VSAGPRRPFTPVDHAEHERYGQRLTLAQGREKLAGALLAQAIECAAEGDDAGAATARRMAEEYATEAVLLHRELKAWRLANGYPG
jgi:hypothetical protein